MIARARANSTVCRESRERDAFRRARYQVKADGSCMREEKEATGPTDVRQPLPSLRDSSLLMLKLAAKQFFAVIRLASGSGRLLMR